MDCRSRPPFPAVDRAAAVAMGWVFGCPILGYLADHIARRKPVVLAGAASMLAAMLASPARGITSSRDNVQNPFNDVACNFIPRDRLMMCSQPWLSMKEIEITSHTPREDLDVRRRRLQFRCWHCGTQEIDLVLGSFAETFLERLDSAELERFEALLDCPDVDLFDWIFVGIAPPPQHDHDLMRRLRSFCPAQQHRSRQLAQHRT